MIAVITGPLGYIMSFLFAWLINELDWKKWNELGFNVNKYGTFNNEGYEFDISTGWE